MPLDIKWFLGYNFIHVYFNTNSNEKVGLNTILTNQFQMHLFLTFIIRKFLNFCSWFTINPIEGSIVSKWSLSKFWIYFLVFLWKTVFFLNWYFLSTFFVYFTMFSSESGKHMFRLSTNKCYNELIKSIEQILNVTFKYKPKRNARLLRHYKMTYFHLECQNLIKNIK